MPVPIEKLRIKWIPDNLRRVVSDSFGDKRRTIGAIVTFVRHQYSNYDSLCATYFMTKEEHKEFKELANQKVRRVLRGWHHSQQAAGHRGLKGIEYYEDIYREDS